MFYFLHFTIYGPNISHSHLVIHICWQKINFKLDIVISKFDPSICKEAGRLKVPDQPDLDSEMFVSSGYRHSRRIGTLQFSLFFFFNKKEVDQNLQKCGNVVRIKYVHMIIVHKTIEYNALNTQTRTEHNWKLVGY